MKLIKRIFLAGFLLLVAYLLLWPVGISPYAWHPQQSPELADEFAENTYLQAATHQASVLGTGPEDIAIDSNGILYGGLSNGIVFKYSLDNKEPQVFVNTGGRPLGLHFDSAYQLIVADTYKGLLSISPDGEITTLSTSCEGVPFKFTDDLDIATDGMIYFTDASHKFDQHRYREDIIEHGPNGRLLKYNPQTKETTLLMDSLRFANGVAVSKDQSFLLVNETGRYRIHRYWLQGPKKGTSDIFADNLPGIPDGVSTGEDGIFWVALFTLRNPALDKLLPYPFLRKIVIRLPLFLQPQPAPYGFILGLDEEGAIVHNLQDPLGGFAPITSVQEKNGVLYLGSLSHPDFAWMPSPD